MTITLGSNIVGLKGQRALDAHSRGVSRAFERLSSGLRINNASDDPAGLQLSALLSNNARLYSQATRNVSDAVSALSIADNALQELTSIATRIRELATQAANGTFSSSQREALDTEAQALGEEFQRIVQVTEFNDQNLLDGSYSNVAIQIGPSGIDNLSITIPEISSVYNGGNGTYGTEVQYGGTAMEIAAELRLIDLNNDGNLDIAFAHGDTNIFSWMLGNGDGTFQAEGGTLTTNSAWDLSTGDIDGDGDTDFVVKGTSQIEIMRNNGNGTLTNIADAPLAAANSNDGVELADINNDGKLDIISQSSNTVVNFFLGNGDGSFLARQTFASSSTFSSIQHATDLDGDGNVDLVFSATGSIKVFMGNGDGTFDTSISYAIGTAAEESALIDITGDGIRDFIHAGTDLEILIGNSDGSFRAQLTYALSGSVTNEITLADINGDGNLDVLSADDAGYIGTGSIKVHFGNGDGSFQAEVSTPLPRGTYSYIRDIQTADVDGDGILDVVLGNGQDSGLATISYFQGLSGTTTGSGFGTISLLTESSARSAMTTVDAVLTALSNVESAVGSYMSRLSVIENFTRNMHVENLAAAARITDIDAAQEVAELVRLQVLQQATTALLAQANVSNSIALSLLA